MSLSRSPSSAHLPSAFASCAGNARARARARGVARSERAGKATAARAQQSGHGARIRQQSLEGGGLSNEGAHLRGLSGRGAHGAAQLKVNRLLLVLGPILVVLRLLLLLVRMLRWKQRMQVSRAARGHNLRRAMAGVIVWYCFLRCGLRHTRHC